MTFDGKLAEKDKQDQLFTLPSCINRITFDQYENMMVNVCINKKNKRNEKKNSVYCCSKLACGAAFLDRMTVDLRLWFCMREASDAILNGGNAVG